MTTQKENPTAGDDGKGVIYDRHFCHRVGDFNVMWIRVTVQEPPYEVDSVRLSSFRDNSEVNLQSISMIIRNDLKELGVLKEA